MIASAMGMEPHNEPDDSISIQVLLKSQFCSAPYQAFSGSLWWLREQLFLGGDEPQTDELCSEARLASNRAQNPAGLSVFRAELCPGVPWGKEVTSS